MSQSNRQRMSPNESGRMMRKHIAIATVVVLGVFLALFFIITPPYGVGVTSKDEMRFGYASDIVSHMLYAQDARTGICFAIDYGRRGLAVVDCDKVRHLLINAESKLEPLSPEQGGIYVSHKRLL